MKHLHYNVFTLYLRTNDKPNQPNIPNLICYIFKLLVNNVSAQQIPDVHDEFEQYF